MLKSNQMALLAIPVRLLTGYADGGWGAGCASLSGCPLQWSSAMKSLLPSARRLIAGLSGAAGALALFGVLQAGLPTLSQVALTIALTALITVAWLFPLPISFKTHLYLDTTFLVTAILTLEPGYAMLAAGAGAALAHLLRNEDTAQTLFNATQAMLQAAAGAGVLVLGGWNLETHRFEDPRLIGVMLLAGIAVIVVNDIAVATMVSLQSGISVLSGWSQAVIRADAVERLTQGAQIGLGIIGAVLLDTYPWTIFLLLIPSAAVYISLKRSIEARKRAEEALRDTEAALAEAQRVAHLGSWDWNLATGDHVWSDEAFRIFGYPPKAFLPTWQTFLRNVHPDDRDAVDQAVHEALYAGQRFSLDHRIIRADGAERYIHAEGEIVFGPKGEKLRIVGTIHDITERKQAEHAREALLASISHDLKSPLTVIRGHAQLLQVKAKRPGVEPAELVEGLGKIDAAAARMAAQLTELLDVTRLQMGQALELHRAPVDLVALVKERASLFQQATRRHTFEIISEAMEVTGEWDRARLERVIDNLLSNAVKYSPAGGRVTVRVGIEQAWPGDGHGAGMAATLMVEDEGIGIPPAERDAIFAPFHRAANVGLIPGTGV
ncbi:MAG: hypothetical protein C4346_06170, partial [Chloroflexota bacterium]